MRFGITPPGCDCPMEFTAFNSYAYHQQKIEDYINILAAAPDPTDWHAQIEAITESDIDYHLLTADDIEYIEREVAKRR